jgi:Cyclin, N-terminal domain
VQAGARAFFQRFYLSNSVMEYDPKLIMLAAIFLTSKVRNLSTDHSVY